jgi:hypothetical protein
MLRKIIFILLFILKCSVLCPGTNKYFLRKLISSLGSNTVFQKHRKYESRKMSYRYISSSTGYEILTFTSLINKVMIQF